MHVIRSHAHLLIVWVHVRSTVWARIEFLCVGVCLSCVWVHAGFTTLHGELWHHMRADGLADVSAVTSFVGACWERERQRSALGDRVVFFTVGLREGYP